MKRFYQWRLSIKGAPNKDGNKWAETIKSARDHPREYPREYRGDHPRDHPGDYQRAPKLSKSLKTMKEFGQRDEESANKRGRLRMQR